jgi:outer membrane protein assembly factor BamB
MLWGNSAGPPDGNHGETQSCIQCHSGSSLNSGNGAINLSGLPSNYALGQTYNLTVAVSGTHSRGYGFQLIAKAGSTASGTLATVSSGMGISNGYAGQTSRSTSGIWNFQWTAPSTNEGNVTFYASGLATGGGTGSDGDQVYTFSQALSAPPSLEWNASTGGVIFSSPAIASDGTVYVGSNDNNLHAFNSDGTNKWTFATGNWVDSTPAIGSDGTIYVGSWDNKLYALNPTDGTKLWDYNTSSNVTASPAIGSDGRIYFGAKDYFFYALDSSGTKLWEYFAGQPVSSSAAIGRDGTVYFGDENGTFHAVNPDGSVKWTYVVDDVTDTNKSILSSPALDLSGSIYFGSGNGYCYSIADNETNASLNWKLATGDRVDVSPVLGIGNEVFFVSRDGYLRSIDTITGISNWETLVGDVFYSSPAVDSNGRVYVIAYTGGGENHLFAYDSNGTKAWDTNGTIPPFTIGGIVDSSLALDANGKLYFGCYDNKLYAVKVGTGIADSDWPQFQRNTKRTGAWPTLNITTDSFPTAGGSVSGSGQYNEGATVTLQATPATGYSFSNWSSGSSTLSTANPYEFNASSDLAVTANLTLQSYAFTISAGTGGTVPGGLSQSYTHGSVVQISATPNTGYVFSSWSGSGIADLNAKDTNVTITGIQSATASFTPINYTLTATAGTGGSANNVTGSYPYDTNVSLVATPDTGYVFSAWTQSGSGISDTSNASTTVRIDGNQSVQATFAPLSYAFTISAGQGGSVPTALSQSYSHGSIVQITATPNTGYAFSSWTGSGITDLNAKDTNVTISGIQSATASFVPISYTLTATAGTGGSVNSASGSYPYDTNVSLVATPATGYAFSAWTQSGSGIPNTSSASTTIRIDSNQSVQATFSPLSHDLNLTAGTGGSIANDPAGTSHNFGSSVTISATPDSGYYFTGWTGSGVSDANASTTTVTISGDQSVQASFALIPAGNFVVQLNANPSSSASALTGAGTYSPNQVIQISASPNAGYSFQNWSGGTFADANSATTTVTVSQDLNLTANFLGTNHQLNVSAGTGGTATGSGSFAFGYTAQISATPGTGYSFQKWDGNLTFSNPFSATTTVTVTQDANLSASFSLRSYSLSTIVSGQGFATGAGTYSHGSQATLTANPVIGHIFTGWSGSGIANSNESTISLTITQDLNVTASFAPLQGTLNVTAGTGGSVNDVNGSYSHNSIVSLVATPDAGYSFQRWDGNLTFADPFSATTSVTVTQDANLSASFTVSSYTVSVNISGQGFATGEGTYLRGTQATLTANAIEGNYFSGWSGSGITDSNESTITLTITQDLNVTASFVKSPDQLNDSIGATEAIASWYSSNWFGYFYQADNGWCYHFNLGWIFPKTQSDGSLWVWSPQLEWLWLEQDTYSKSFIWSADDGNWLYFDFDTTGGPRIHKYLTDEWSTFDKDQAIDLEDSVF